MAGRFVFHIQKMTGVFQAHKLTVLNRADKMSSVIGRGVFIPCAIDEQHRNLDAPGRIEEARMVASQDLVDVKVHLRVLMFGQAADMPEVEAFEQRR